MDKLALIVLNYNSLIDTEACVGRLLSFEQDYHIVVVDNCSTDNSYEMLCAEYDGNDSVDVIRTDRNGGYGYGNNYGMKYAIARYDSGLMGILNPDVMIPELKTMERMVEVLESDPSYGIVGGIIIDHDGNELPERSGWNIQTSAQLIRDHFLIYDRFKNSPPMKEIAPGILQTDCVAGCFFMARTSCMREIAFFDEEMFMYQEESAIGIKCREHGLKVVIASDAHYYHDHHDRDDEGMTFREKILATKADYDSLSYICRRYYSPVLIPFLSVVECFNRIYLAGCYVKFKLFG